MQNTKIPNQKTVKSFENYVLFQECLDALEVSLLSEQESNTISDILTKIVPITRWGKIDWDKIDQKIAIGCHPESIIPTLEKLSNRPIDKTVYIEWSNRALPVIKSDLDKIITKFDDVSCVALEKFIFNTTYDYIIEILPGDRITVGLIDAKKII